MQSYVLACGVRKVWSKIFAISPSSKDQIPPKAQIAKLKEMLSELGMEGRYTMEKAKAIREKREFEKELGELTFRSTAVPYNFLGSCVADNVPRGCEGICQVDARA